MENNDILLEEEESSIISLTDENGEETEFEYLDCIEYNGKEYLVLIPAEEDANEIVILEVEPVDEENENYLAVDDEATLDAVYEIFKERYKDLINTKSCCGNTAAFYYLENLTGSLPASRRDSVRWSYIARRAAILSPRSRQSTIFVWASMV